MSALPLPLIRLVKHMQHWQRLHYVPYRLYLSQKAVEQASREGYQALAQLIKAGHFSVIVTTNSSEPLERGLESAGVELTVLGIDEDADEQVLLQALEDPSDKVYIIKLSQDYEHKTATMAPLTSAIQRYLCDDLIVVGQVTPNSKLMEMIQPNESSSTYYCIHTQPSPDDSILQLLKIKKALYDDFLICGEYGHFDMFFKTIVSLLCSKETAPEVSLDHSHSPKKEKQAKNVNKIKNSVIYQNSQKEAIHFPNTNKADILLVTVTDIEAQAILSRFPSAKKYGIAQQIYYDLGSIGSAYTVMARSTDMGPFAARHCVDEGIAHFSPRAVIMAGIAYGLRPSEQDIGDILVAKQIMNCDFQKVRTRPDMQPEILPRGSSIPVADGLLAWFQAGQLDWKPPPHIHFGQILSSSRLIDHEGTRDALLPYFPEAIGGEMEGHGLCDVCSRKKVDWILVKAICDWADGHKGENKDDYQRQAANNAARFVLSVIKQYGFTS